MKLKKDKSGIHRHKVCSVKKKKERQTNWRNYVCPNEATRIKRQIVEDFLSKVIEKNDGE